VAGTAGVALPATAAASAESNESVMPPLAGASLATPARYPVSVAPRASATDVTGGHDRSAAAAAVAAVTSATAPPRDKSTAAQSVTPAARDTKSNNSVNGPYQGLSRGTCIYFHA